MKHKKNEKGYIALTVRYLDPITGANRRRVVYCKTEKEATEKKAAFLSTVQSGLRVDDSNLTVQQ